MTFTNPWGLLFLGLMAPIVLMHLLRSDRRRVIVPSALLWDDDPDSRTAARPWQRLRWTLPLILQLIVVALASLALAGPALRRATPLAAHTVVVLDASLSMGARDGSSDGATRADAAADAVDQLIGDVPRGGVVSVIVAGASPRIAVARSGDDDEIRRQVGTVTLDPSADLRGAAALATGVIRPDEATSVVLVTDGGWTADAVAELPAGTREVRVGSRDLNVAVGPLSVEDQGSSMVVRAPVRSTGTERVPGGRVLLTIAVDGRVAVRRAVEVGATATSDATAETRAVVPKGERIVAAIAPLDEASGALDLFTDDNAAYAVAERRVRRVLVIGTADPFLDRALESIEGLEVERSVRPISGDGADAVIYNGVSVPGDPGTGFLAIAPPGGAPGVRVIGELMNPAPTLVRTDLDVLSGLDLSGLVVGAAQRVLVGDVADAETEGDLDAARRRSIDVERSVGLLRDVQTIVGDDRGPLVFSGEYSGKPFTYVTFPLRQSNLGVQVAFPLLVERLLADLGGTGRGAPAITAGQRLAVPSDAASVVRAPAGASTPVAPGDAGPVAAQPGFWEITPEGGTTTLVAVDADPTESFLTLPPPLPIRAADGSRAAGAAAAASELQSLRALIIGALIILLAWEGVVVARRRFVPGRAKAALAIRLLVAGCCIAALLGPEIDRRVDDVGVVVVVDESASMRGTPAAAAAQTLDRLRTSAGDRRFVVVRVADGAALTGSAPTGGFADATDIASGLRVASGALPDTMARRVVLVSDGRATVGDAPAVARSLRERGIGLDVVPIAPSGAVDAAVVGVDVADGARAGEEVLARIRVRSSVAGAVSVVVTPASVVGSSGKAPAPAPVSATAQVPASGEVTVEVPIIVGTAGVSRYTARVTMASDVRPENDSAGFAVVARAPGRVLVVEGSADAARYIAPALTAGGLGIEVVAPAGVPTATGLIAYDAVVLADVGARDLSGAQTAALSSAVRDTGLGLVVLGGPRSFGFGGYLGSALEALLPVTSDITGRNRRASVAQVLAVDTSSSMAACHCNRFDANGKLTLPVRIQGGIDKTLLAKAAAARTIEALSGVDQVGVVAFTGETKILVPLQRVSDPAAAIAALDPIRADGATSIGLGLTEARNQLKDAKADLRHIVLLTDGFSVPEDLAKLEQQAREINAEGITISVVGVGEGSDPLLERVATAGGGRFYANDDLLAVPEVVMQEAVVASRPFLVEETAFPRVTSRAAPVRDLTEAPPVRGHLATTPRESAEVLLDLPIGEGNDALSEAVEAAGEEELRNPLLATWRVGLGRTTAWTSDATARWAEPWVQWDGFTGFWTAVVTEALRPPTAGGAGVRVTPTETGVRVDVEVGSGAAPNATADAALVGPDGASVNVPLPRTGERSFGAEWAGVGADAVGGWVGEVSVRSVGAGGAPGLAGDVVASGTGVGVRSWPVEWLPPLPTATAAEARMSLLSLSRVAGGRGELGSTADAFAASGLRGGRRGVSLAPWLLGALLLLWPIDVAVRRLGTGRSEGPRGPRRARPTGALGVRALRRAGRFVAPSAPRWP